MNEKERAIPSIFEGIPFIGHILLPNPFRAYCEGANGKTELATLTPAIVRDMEGLLSLGVYVNDRLGLFGSFGFYNDIIAFWRATEIMPYCKEIDEQVFGHLIAIVSRYPGSVPRLNVALRSLIVGNYDSIYQNVMEKNVPEEIIQAVLDSQSVKFPASLDAITEEVRAGTIQWREEFVKFGILRPDEKDVLTKSRQAIAARYLNSLNNYVLYVEMNPKGREIEIITDQVIELVEKGIEKDHSAPVVVALAAIVGMLSMISSAVIVGPSNLTRDIAEHEMRNSILSNASAWLAKQEKTWWKLGPTTNQDIMDAYFKLEKLAGEYYLGKRPDSEIGSGKQDRAETTA
jgi:hypothetical protein